MRASLAPAARLALVLAAAVAVLPAGLRDGRHGAVRAGAAEGGGPGALSAAPDSTAGFSQLPQRLYYGYGTLCPALGDMDGDGDPDLPGFRNEGHLGFVEIPQFRELLAAGNYHGSAWCDYDRDGRLDLAVLPYAASGSPLRLLHQLPDGTFEDAAPRLGMNVEGYGETAVWGDFNGDGWPDLFAPFYAHHPPHRSFLFLGDGRGGFVEAADAAGVAMRDVPEYLKPEGAAAADFDDDGDLDLYCASRLFWNDGTGRFEDIREDVGLPERFDEGAAFVDYDNDGDLDLYLRHVDSGRLYRNDAGWFTDATAGSGIARVRFYWGDTWSDVDHDGRLDLLYFVRDAGARLMRNRGGGRFACDTSFFRPPLRESLSAWGDLDRDGDLDLVVGGGPTRLFTNRGDAWPGYADRALRVRVLDAGGRESEHGATVRLQRLDRPEEGIQTRVIDGGSGYLTQSEYDAHFGVDPDGTYALSVRFIGRPGERVVVDAATDPILGAIRPREVDLRRIEVRRDGSVTIPRGVLAAPAAARARLPFAWGAVVPNPARAAATVSFTLGERARVEVAVLDVAGARVRSLLRGELEPGTRTVRWDLRDERGARVPPGVYFYQAMVGRTPVEARRIGVLR